MLLRRATTSSVLSKSVRYTHCIKPPLTLSTRTSYPPGSGIGSDPCMISANHRIQSTTTDQRRHFSGTAAAAPATTTTTTTAAAMEDEYGEMTADGDTHVEPNFVLENGIALKEAQLRYQTYGSLNDAKDNVIVVCHALTGNASLHSWWGELLGPNKAFDTSKYMIICCNILGSCYGSTNPQSVDPTTGKRYSKDFPDISVQDTVKLQLLLLKNKLNVKSVKAVIGGSFGGMQAVEFAVQAGITGGDFCQEDGTYRYYYRYILSIYLLLLLLLLSIDVSRNTIIERVSHTLYFIHFLLLLHTYIQVPHF